MEINEMANKNVQKLKLYLAQLPLSLPVPSNPHPDFRKFAPKAGILPGDKAVQEALEDAMGPFNSSNFVISERGPGIQALGDVMERYLAQYPLSLPLQQWLYMALLAAENTFRRYNIKLPSLDAQPHVAPTMIMSVPPRAGQARYSATSFRSYYAPAPTTPGLFVHGLAPTGSSPALRASERTASALSAQSATASRETSRTSNSTLTSKDKGTKMIPMARKPSEATVPRRAKSTPKTKHEAYSAPVIVLDERLRQHVEALKMTCPCLRTHSYLVPKLPWLSDWISDTALLETGLQRHIDSLPICEAASGVDNTASGSSNAADQVHSNDLLLRFSRKLDVWEHGGIYRNIEKACIAFRWMGIESEGSVRLGADRFVEIGSTKMEDCQWLVALRALDVLAWACWPHVQPLSAANATTVARNNGHALSYLLSAPVNNPVGWATCSADWVSRISKVADSGAIKSSVHHIMSCDAIAQLKTFSWDDKRPPTVPERQNLDNALPRLLKAATGTLSVDLVHREFAATHSNLKAAAAALGFIMHEYGSDNETEDNRLVDLTELKDRIIAAQEKHQVTNLTAKNLMYPLAVALFVSPIFLFNKVQLVKNVLPFEELFETWKLLGNKNRPEALSRIERDIWKLLLRVLDGADLMACLLSYLEYWKVTAPDLESEFEEARTWFKPGHLLANMRATARQGNMKTASQTNAATSSHSVDQANSCIDPQLLTDHAVTHDAAGPSNEAARNGVHGVKRHAEAQAQAESSKKPRLSVSTSPTPGDRSVETGSNISPLAGRTTPTPSQDDDSLYFTEDPPFLPLNESPTPSTAQSADSVRTAAEEILNRPSSEALLASALAEVNRLRSDRDALQAEHEPLKTEYKALKAEAAKLRSDRGTLSERLSALSGRLATTQNLVERAEGRERALGAELASVRLRKEKALALEATLAESNARADSAEDHVRQLKAEREDLLVKLRASESAVATARSEAQRISAERHAHVEDVTGKLEGVSANIAILTKAVEAWRIQSQQIAAERDSLLQGMRELLPAEAGPAPADSSDVLHSVAAEMERLREQVLDADQRASNADQRAATAEQERASMEDAHDRRAAHVTVLQRRIAELESNSWKF